MAETWQQLSTEMADMIDGAADSVLRVEARRRLPATGIAWSENLIVTAHHVVETDDDISIGTSDGARIDAELIGRDPRYDLALLRVNATLAPANRARAAADLRIGNLVLALGRPRLQVAATLGIVSGLVSADAARQKRARMRVLFEKSGPGKGPGRRRKRWQKRIAKEIGGGWGIPLAGGHIATDVTMYPGFSGGPLLGVDGKVYGMNTSGFGAGFSVAVPLAAISSSVDALLAHGKIQSGYLGIGVQPALLPDDVAETLQQEAGLLIVSVDADSPAAATGLLVGDILTALDAEAVEEVDELQAILAASTIGSSLTSGFVRGGDIREGSIIVGAR